MEHHINNKTAIQTVSPTRVNNSKDVQYSLAINEMDIILIVKDIHNPPDIDGTCKNFFSRRKVFQSL